MGHSMTAALCALAVAAALPSSARAQGQPPAREADARRGESLSLSLKEAIDRAQLRAPEVVMAGHAVREARARRVGAGIVTPTNPRLSFDARPPISGAPMREVGYAASLDFLFEVGGAPSARVREAERGAELAQVDLALERLRAKIAAWSAYLRVGIAEARLAESKSLVGIGERILSASRQRAEAGAAGEIEQSLAMSDLAQLRASIEGVNRQREGFLSELRDVLDLPSDQPLVLTTALEDPPPASEEAELVARAMEARPEFAQIKKRVAVLDATYDRLKREVFPRVGGYIGVDASPVSPVFGIVGLSVELPFIQRNQGPRAVVEAQRGGEMDRLELQARRVAREVSAARTAYERRRGELKLLTENALPSADRTLQLVEAGWLSGRFDVFRVASAARDVARVRGLRLDALEAAWLERIALDRAVGGVSR
jgi:cobalt-zinc-cadmium efflux system outer membrane protein